MMLRQFTKCLVVYCLTLIFLSNIVISSFVPKSKDIEKTIGNGEKIKGVTLTDINKASYGELREPRNKEFASGSSTMSYDTELRTTRPKIDTQGHVSESDVETSSNIAEEVKNQDSNMELITKLHNLSGEVQNLSNKDVYVNFQSLIENLKHYQSKDLSRLGLNDESSLLSHKELGNLILQDFKKTFEHIFQNFNHDFKIENLPEIPIALHTIDWLALSLNKNHWGKLELGFIRAHMDSLLKMKNTRANFEEILKAMEEAPSFDPNWLKVLNMDSVEKDLPAFYGEKSLAMRNSLHGDNIITSAQSIRHLNLYSKTRFLNQYKNLEKAYKNFIHLHSLINIFHENDKLISWEYNTPMYRLYNELFALQDICKFMERKLNPGA
ncbi:hypothetical protein BY996DRAFT_6411253 [Phakopsora pachyrhizi]|nr:hypothetical protein BY996DRAFT_6411253 [Phakopsora pachyrhizi]